MRDYYIPINDTTFELSVFWSSGTESRIVISLVMFTHEISLQVVSGINTAIATIRAVSDIQLGNIP